MSYYYMLDGKKAVPCDREQWAFQSITDRVVAKTNIGDTEVSTVFLGINHAFSDGPPLLFETMIFGGAHSDYQKRCSTWEQAEAQHAVAVKLVEAK